MNSLKKSLIFSALMVPGVLNAAMLRFDFSATEIMDLGFLGTHEVGLLPGSYFVVDTSVSNTSTNPTSTLFADSIVSGHVDANDPLNGGLVSADITDANSGSITGTNNGVTTTWSIPVEGQSSTMEINYSGLDLYTNLLDDPEFYNDNFLGGSITANGMTIALNHFFVSDVSTAPAPVPLPPTVFLMASALGMMLWRSNLSFSQVRQLLAS